MQDKTPLPWHRQAAAIVPRHMALKGMGTMVFISVFFSAYFYLLKTPAYPTTVMPFTLMDQLISFQPLAMPLYLSLWLYVSLPPLLFGVRRELIDYGLAMTATCLAGLVIFYFWPTTVPPANIDWALHPGVDFLKNMDASGNAFPSLHVATAVFSGLWLHRLLSRIHGPGWLLLLNAVWCIGIVYSTLATRQHVVLDVAGGLLLGGVAAGLSLRRYRPATKAAPVDSARAYSQKSGKTPTNQ